MARICRTLLVLAVAVELCGACSLAPGYFHQVTLIRGRVVGRDLGPLGFRWLRQSFIVRDATLSLYEYRSAGLQDLRQIASVKTDDHGNFDFGPIPKGHYFLNIVVKGSDRLGGLFDVEVTDSVRATKGITIDISPIHPDCTGGHEFLETKS
jgi:hypothetical protein